jgi:hypothetical protein
MWHEAEMVGIYEENQKERGHIEEIQKYTHRCS